jgi:hypothetical protein
VTAGIAFTITVSSEQTTISTYHTHDTIFSNSISIPLLVFDIIARESLEISRYKLKNILIYITEQENKQLLMFRTLLNLTALSLQSTALYPLSITSMSIDNLFLFLQPSLGQQQHNELGVFQQLRERSSCCHCSPLFECYLWSVLASEGMQWVKRRNVDLPAAVFCPLAFAPPFAFAPVAAPFAIVLVSS